MSSRICDKCGSEVSDQASVCPSCGTPVPPADPTLLPNGHSVARKNALRVTSIVVACLLVGVLVAICWVTTRGARGLAPQIAETINIEEVQARAERGEAEAQKELGDVYARGKGVKQSYVEAAKWYRKAAEQGHAGAQTALGELCEAGQGVPHDDTEAAKWYRLAAEQGHVAGQYNLAVLYVVGKGVPPDDTEALKWYRKAADQGDGLAQYNLGMRYYEGRGVTADPVEAYKWLSLAAAQGLTDASKVRAGLQQRMTREQINEGRRRAGAFAAVPRRQ